MEDFASDLISGIRLHYLVLMTSEIVTNAVQHGLPQEDGKIGLRLEREEGVVRVIIVDGGSEFTFDRATFDDTQPSYDRHGLLIVDSLADRWGVALDGKKAVWVEMRVQ